jgi:hypothetical protein
VVLAAMIMLLSLVAEEGGGEGGELLGATLGSLLLSTCVNIVGVAVMRTLGGEDSSPKIGDDDGMFVGTTTPFVGAVLLGKAVSCASVGGSALGEVVSGIVVGAVDVSGIVVGAIDGIEVGADESP